VFFVIGANMADCHPILFLRMMDRVKAGAKLIVVDPRRNATAAKADLFLQIKPGTDLALLNGLLHLLHENGHTDPAFIAAHTEGWEAMPPSWPTTRRPPSPSSPAWPRPTSAGRAMDRRGGEWMSCWTMGLNQSTHGTWNTNAICNLHLATGAICRPGSGPFSLTGQPNAMGGREMGYMGPGLPGQRSVLVARTARSSSRPVGLAPGTLRGPSRPQRHDRDVRADGRGRDQGLLDHLHQSGGQRRQPADRDRRPGRAELVITQDVFSRPRPTRYADVVLPGALWAEAEGVMINSERNLTLMQKAVEPPGEALPDWQIIARVAWRWASPRASLRVGRGSLRGDQALLESEDRLRPARRQLRAAAETRCSGRSPGGRERPQSDPLPQRRRQPTLRDGPTGPSASSPFPPRAASVFFARPHMPRRDARRRLPLRAQHRPPAAPVAHHDQDRQGRDAQQAQPRPLRRDPSRRRRALGIAEGDRSRSARGAAARCCRRS
jgi:sulfite reductase (NADPH) flavoprotein alpha-component